MAYLPVLVALEQNGALLQKQLAEQAHVGQPAMAALLGRMERDGLISRKPDPNDKRSSRIVLSAKARARVPKAKERLQEVADRAIAGFGEDERATLMALLRRIVHNLAEPVEEQTTREESTASPTVDRRPRKVRSS
jgi:DNA-binding MarR family transcriptional regulator